MRTWHGSAGGAIRIGGGVLFLLVLAALIGAAAWGQDKPPRTIIVVFGDSQAQGLAVGLQRYLIGRPQYKVLNRTHPGAAIVHGESEWLDPILDFASRETAALAIVMLGANDRLDMRVGEDDRYLHFRTAAWRSEYAMRLDLLFAALDRAHLKSVWLGNPIARSATYSADMSYINGIIEERVAAAGAHFIPLWNVVVDDAGKYTAYGKDLEGTTERLRTDDGIHFTAAGYRLVAARIMAVMFPKTAAAAPVHPRPDPSSHAGEGREGAAN